MTFARLGVDARNPTGRILGNVQRATRADGAAAPPARPSTSKFGWAFAASDIAEFAIKRRKEPSSTVMVIVRRLGSRRTLNVQQAQAQPASLLDY